MNTSTIQSFERDTPVSEMLDALYRDGVVIVREAVERSRMQELQEAVDARVTDQPFADAHFFGGAHRVKFGLFSEGGFVDLLVDPLVGELTDAVLLPNCNAYQVHATSCGQVEAGGNDQPLHRADDIFEPFLPYEPGGPVRILSFMWAGSDFTAGNGATKLAPGSHLWPRDRQATDADLVQAVMPQGSFACWLGGTVHGLSASTADDVRRSIFTSFSAGWLRQEENQYLTVPLEVVEQLPLRAQQLLGYRVFGSALGFVEGRDGNCLLEEGDSLNLTVDLERGGQAIANTPGPDGGDR